MKALRVVAVAAAALLAAAAPAMAQAPGPVTIRFIAAPSDDLLPFLYAQDKGMFRAAGLNVVASLAQTGALVTKSIADGTNDVGKTSLGTLISSHVAGLPFVMIAPSAIHSKTAPPNSAMMISVNSPLKTALDLQGKTVSCTAIGDIGYLGLRTMIDGQGGDSTTIKWVEIPTAGVAAALEAGRMDAGLVTEPFMARDLAAGKVRMLVDMLNGYPTEIMEGGYFTVSSFAKANHDALARFARVLRDAAVYTNAHVAETLPLLVAGTGLDPAIAAKMHHAVVGITFDPAQIQPVIDAEAKYKIIPHGFDAREMLF